MPTENDLGSEASRRAAAMSVGRGEPRSSAAAGLSVHRNKSRSEKLLLLVVFAACGLGTRSCTRDTSPLVWPQNGEDPVPQGWWRRPSSHALPGAWGATGAPNKSLLVPEHKEFARRCHHFPFSVLWLVSDRCLGSLLAPQTHERSFLQPCSP